MIDRCVCVYLMYIYTYRWIDRQIDRYLYIFIF